MLFIKQNKKKPKDQNASKWNYGWKNRNDRSACVKFFSEHYTRMNSTSHYWSYNDFYTLPFLLLTLYLYSMHCILHHKLIFTIHYSTRFSFLQITFSLLRNWNNRTNNVWAGFFCKCISLNEVFCFWKPKISFTEMSHESIEKQFNLNYYFMKYSERKISQCILPFTQLSEYVRICLGRIYSGSKYVSILQGFGYAIVTQGSKLATMWLSISEKDVNMSQFTITDRSLNKSHAMENPRSLYQLISNFWEMGIFSTLSKI